MIEYIKGDIVELYPTQLIIECNGIAYKVNISLTTHALIANAETCKIYIYEIIREDTHELFGFAEKRERELFMLLITVPGVGAQTARMILSSFSTNELETLIASGDAAALQTVKGIGGKTAQRVIVDLKDKITPNALISKEILRVDNKIVEEAVSALIMLGFTPAVSKKAIASVLKITPDATVEQAIKAALKML